MKNVCPKTVKYMNSKEGSNVCQNIEKNSNVCQNIEQNSGISSVDKVEEYCQNYYSNGQFMCKTVAAMLSFII